MSRRAFLGSCAAFAAAAALPAPVLAAYQPSRIQITVRGSGPDVILIHGLSASRGVWNSTVAAMPGYRFHMVQILGFAGTAAGGNARGKVAAGVAEEIARYIAANRLGRAPSIMAIDPPIECPTTAARPSRLAAI
jgi:pimeloyl-ACP methyl ester carboxylesterase